MLLRLMSLSLCVLLENRVLTCCPLPCWKRMVFWLAVGTNHPFQMQHPLNDRRACEGAAERLMQTWPWPAWRDQTVWECLVGRPAWSAQTACEPEARDTRWLTWRCLPWSGQTASDQQARSLSFPPNPPLLLCLSSIQGEAPNPLLLKSQQSGCCTEQTRDSPSGPRQGVAGHCGVGKREAADSWESPAPARSRMGFSVPAGRQLAEVAALKARVAGICGRPNREGRGRVRALSPLHCCWMNCRSQCTSLPRVWVKDRTLPWSLALRLTTNNVTSCTVGGWWGWGEGGGFMTKMCEGKNQNWFFLNSVHQFLHKVWTLCYFSVLWGCFFPCFFGVDQDV